ncbi:MAG TPA: DUF2889 domain-containing protein [Burkholderiales bacterium]|nr:DUF2889 domain-containing protein [Burkholderiales bacterium]
MTCRGYLREDGLWDIEGHLVDTKAFDAPREEGSAVLPAGKPLHEMWIRLTVDTDLLVHHAEAVTDAGPYGICGDVTPNFKQLEGLTIKAGWTVKTRELLGGIKGCTHLVELLGPVATTAFQTVYSSRVKRDAAKGVSAKPGLINTCHAYADDGALVKKRWPQWYRGREEEATAIEAGNGSDTNRKRK